MKSKRNKNSEKDLNEKERSRKQKGKSYLKIKIRRRKMLKYVKKNNLKIHDAGKERISQRKNSKICVCK